MFASYFIIALQALKQQPVFSIIKILSLAIGLACSILVIMHVQYSNSFDKHFPNWENTYRLVTSLYTDQQLDTVMSSDANAPQLALDYPQIEHIAKIREASALFSRVDTGNEAASRNAFFWAEADIIDIFSLEFISGDAGTALAEPNVIVLTETAAAKYFPGEEALGQTLIMDSEISLRVSGVMQDLPENTHIDMQMMISVDTGRQIYGENEDFMGGNAWFRISGTFTYLTLPGRAEAEYIDNDLVNFIDRNLPDEQRSFISDVELALSLQPLGDIYLSPRQGFGESLNNRAQVLFGLSVFAVLILITSCINFANLSLAQIQLRAKEIGVRKTLGAKRIQVIIQFLFESMLLTLLALCIALPCVYFLIPVYTALTNTGFTFADTGQSSSVLLLFTFVIATGLVSGFFPALMLAKFQPAAIIKGISAAKGKTSQVSRSLITMVQFTLSTTLIMLAIAITQQISYLNSMNLGFDKNNLVILDSTYNRRDPESFNYTAMLNEIRQHPAIISVSTAESAPPSTGFYNPWRLPGAGPNDALKVASYYGIDASYLDTMGMTLLAGRDFDDSFPSDFQPQYNPNNPPLDEDATFGVILTRYGVRNFGFSSPQDALDKIVMAGESLRYRVIGVIEDFRLTGALEDSLRSPSILTGKEGPMRNVLIRLDPAQRQNALDHIDTVWQRHRPDIAIDRFFYAQRYNDIVSEQTSGFGKASIFASIITVLISAFGLYALAFYSTQRRTKEVGVRKVLGASSRSLISLLTWDFVKPVLIACFLSWGIGYYAISVYFQQFSSQVAIPLLLYVLVTLGTLLVAALTVASQCFKAANTDPVACLRYE